MPTLAACSWSLRTASPDELADALARCGLDAVQLALVPCAEEPAAWGHAVEALRARGIRTLSGMLATVGEDYSTLESIARTGGVRPDATWPATRARAAAVAELAARAGICLVTFHAGFIPHDRADPGRRAMVARLREVADLFAARGVRVAFETGQEDAGTLLGALEEIAHPNVGVNFDPANMILYGMGDPVASLRALAAHVVQVHVKDAVPTAVPGTWGREAVAGTGAVDWPAFLAEVARLPRAVDLVIEREAGPTREADIAAAAALVRRLAPGFAPAASR
ncbi:MAG: sugar phosphate isomerase/epimerase family protein [Phycisphaerales bacterium]